MRNLRNMLKKAMERAALSIRAPFGDPGGCPFFGTFERQMKEGTGNGACLINFIRGSFLDPDYVRSLNLGAILNFCEGAGLPCLGISLWGTKGLFKGLGALGPKGLEPSYYSILFPSHTVYFFSSKCLLFSPFVQIVPGFVYRTA